MSQSARSLPPRLFSISPSVDFLPTFARAFLAGEIVGNVGPVDDPEGLSSATIFVPTRRAAGALADAFSRAFDNPVILLPKIVPLGRLEDIETQLSFEQVGLDGGFVDGLPEAVDDMQRRLSLTRMIFEWAKHLRYAITSIEADGKRQVIESENLLVAASPASAWSLSGDLASLIDDMTIEGVEWSALSNLAPSEYDRFWRITLDFLKIAMQAWPEYLAEHGWVDAVARQQRLIDAEVGRLMHAASGRPIIALGSTGANPATARLLGAIARQPRGAVVLPGLDFDLNDLAWAMIPGDAAARVEPSDGHPQAVLHRLLIRLGVTRADVREIGAPSPFLAARSRFVSQAMCPADATDTWRQFADAAASGISDALRGVTLIEAADEREEALCIAIEARRMLEVDYAIGALITPDRQLARRVKSELARWNIDVDDSGGESVLLTPLGTLLRLILAAAAPDSSVVEKLALLSHARVRMGSTPDELRRLVNLVEIGVWRSVDVATLTPAEAIDSARQAAQGRDAHRAARAISDADWLEMQRLLEHIEECLRPLREMHGAALLKDWATAHSSVLQSILGEVPADDELVAICEMFDALIATTVEFERMSGSDYAAWLDQILSEMVVRGGLGGHPRFKILGPLEARLLHANTFILGGLDEAIWPPAARADAFLNRPMRAALGLGPPERRIGQSAHDFVQAFGAQRVVLTRARKRGAAPTTASRFLLRMSALAGEVEWGACRERGDAVIRLARALDEKSTPPIAPPKPRPPVAWRPTSLSVTRIEKLRRDPYGVYAERILRLRPLGSLLRTKGALEKGNILHEAVAEFVRLFPTGPLPANAIEWLQAETQKKFATVFPSDEFHAFLWPQISGTLTAYVAWETGRRAATNARHIECSGRLPIALTDGSVFTLTAQADRIERCLDGSWAVIDFKTGKIPSPKEIASGFSPQLTLETAMLERGAFANIAGDVSQALYVKLSDGDKFKVQRVGGKEQNLQELVVLHFTELRTLLDQYRDETTPYLSQPYPQFLDDYSDYNHLARVKEWSAGGAERDE